MIGSCHSHNFSEDRMGWTEAEFCAWSTEKKSRQKLAVINTDDVREAVNKVLVLVATKGSRKKLIFLSGPAFTSPS